MTINENVEADGGDDALQVVIRKMSPNNLSFFIQVQCLPNCLGQFRNLGSQISRTWYNEEEKHLRQIDIYSNEIHALAKLKLSF